MQIIRVHGPSDSDRCRRLRIKCVQDNGKAPCAPCTRAGPAERQTCGFASRGDDQDRRFRIKRPPTEGPQQPASATPTKFHASSAEATSPLTVHRDSVAPLPVRKFETFSTSSDIWDQLPPHEEILAGVRTFVTCCTQVGFIPKALFLERLANHRETVNVFLILAILSVGARFTPELCRRFGGPGEASKFFLETANAYVAEEMYKTKLDTAQAFYLLATAEWAKGERDRSSVCIDCWTILNSAYAL